MLVGCANSNLPEKNISKKSVNDRPSSNDKRGFKKSLFREFLDIFSIDFKCGIGIDLSFIFDIGIDLFSQAATFSSEGYSEYYTQGFNSGVYGYSNSTSTSPAITGFREDGNSTITIGPVQMSEKGTDVVASFGGQVIIGAYINISLNEAIDFWGKLNEAVHK